MTSEECGASWLLDLRWVALAVLVLVAMVAAVTRYMR